MSKEITPKEALNELCDLATPNGDCINYVIGMSGIILKALDRLEYLEKENQELRDKAIAYDKIVDLRTTSNILETTLANFMNKCIVLEKEIENKDKAFEILDKLCENQTELIGKYEKAINDFIEWIKEQFRKNDNQAILGKATYTNVVELALLTHILDKLKEYDLLKEVLGNE